MAFVAMNGAAALPRAAAQTSRVLGGPQSRNMATLKEIKTRLVSVTNIQKITKSMKMVSAAKFSRAERQLKAGLPFARGATGLVKTAEIEIAPEYKGRLLVAMSSDRGLCGGIHSTITKSIRPVVKIDDEAKVFIWGDKVRAQMRRIAPQLIQSHFAEIGKKPPTFLDAATLTDHILNSDVEWEKGQVWYNEFVSAIAYEPTAVVVYNPAKLGDVETIASKYEVDEGTLESYGEFTLASTLYGSMLIAQASEQSARMQAMENATKNAGDMIEKLTLRYNRTRQAVITNELIEIISGAAAV
eukprot:CFRG4292T1